MTPWEDELRELVSFVRFTIGEKNIGAYLLAKPKVGYQLVFAWKCAGIPPLLRDDRIDTIFDNIENGFKNMPDGDTLTFHFKNTNSDEIAQETLDGILSEIPSEERLTKALVVSQKKRTQVLSKKGIRKPKELWLFVKVNVNVEKTGKTDWIEVWLSQLLDRFRKFTGEYYQQERDLLFQTLTYAYDRSEEWNLLLLNKLGLKVEAQSPEKMFEKIWREANPNKEIIPVPQIINFDGAEIIETIDPIYGDRSLATYLAIDEAPIANPNFVRYGKKYRALLTLTGKPPGWRDKMSQLRYLWEIIARDNVEYTDIYVEIEKGNQRAVRDKMMRLTKQATVDSQQAKGGPNILAELNIEKSIEAQRALYDNDTALRMSTILEIRRDTIEELDRACQDLQSLVQHPVELEREEYTWVPWLQCLPVHWQKIHSNPYDRRSISLTSEVAGFLPLVNVGSLDRQGMELIAYEGGHPVHIDLYHKHRNVALFGATRSGKSVLVAEMLLIARTKNIPVLAIDYPRPDGTSTFSHYVELLEGSYFNILSENLNLMEIPDLREFSLEERNNRFQDFLDTLIDILMLMIVGLKPSESLDVNTIRSILVLAASRFFDDREIKDRYADAFKLEFGSLEWRNMPVLTDFIRFCSLERLQINGSEKEVEALAEIKLRLTARLETRIGKALGTYSTIASNSHIFVVALANISNQEDAAIMAAVSNLIVTRNALRYKQSIYFVDEAPILLSLAPLAEQVGKSFANGAKSGIRMVLAAQEPGSVFTSAAADKIRANLDLRLIGKILPTDQDNYTDYLKVPKSIISQWLRRTEVPPCGYSSWLIDDGIGYTECRYYAPELLLAMVANNPHESAIRIDCLNRNPDPVKALLETSRQLQS
jgi:hypothetical protein